MHKPKACSDADFIELLEKYGPAETARRLNREVRGVYERRERLEGRIGRQITGPRKTATATRSNVEHPHRLSVDIQTGVILICSDGHYWPGPASTAHRAFVKFCKDLKPSTVIMNGDALDGARISRHAPIGWEKRPELIDEIEACKERLGEIEKAAFKARKIWGLGNHDSRFETRIATVVPEYAKIHGVHLRDHFEAWEPCWSVWINDDAVVKHRFRGGIHARHNNVIWAGKTIITGHTHALGVTPFPDYNGVRWGVETGCLADPEGAQFVDYTEDGPKRWEAGFVVLTFKDGVLLPPELVTVWSPDQVAFRGALIKV